MHFRIAAVARRNIMVDAQKSCQLAGIARDHLTWPRFGFGNGARCGGLKPW